MDDYNLLLTGVTRDFTVCTIDREKIFSEGNLINKESESLLFLKN